MGVGVAMGRREEVVVGREKFFSRRFWTSFSGQLCVAPPLSLV